jgi:YD repeat-containing protein
MKIILVVLISIIAIGCGAFFLVVRSQDIDVCTPLLPIAQSKEFVNSIDGQTSELASTTVDVMGRSTEGGTQTTFTRDGLKQIVEQRFYAETGRSYMRFYFYEGRLFAIVKLNMSYAAPISVDSSGAIKSSEERDYYLDDKGRVCVAEVNGVSQPIGDETQDMIREYVAGIL